MIVLLLLSVVIESAVLQLMRWGSFRSSLRAALLMNLASMLISYYFLYLLPSLGWIGLLLSWATAVLIEGGVLNWIKRGQARQNWLVGLAANLASYLMLFLPAYLQALKGR